LHQQKAIAIEKRAWESERKVLKQDCDDLESKVVSLQKKIETLEVSQEELKEELEEERRNAESLQQTFEHDRRLWEKEKAALRQEELNLEVISLLHSLQELDLLLVQAEGSLTLTHARMCSEMGPGGRGGEGKCTRGARRGDRLAASQAQCCAGANPRYVLGHYRDASILVPCCAVLCCAVM
jgi:hypothetical protein